MSKLFEVTEINGMKLKNRFVRSATYEAMAALDGTVEPPLLTCTEQLARGEVGLIITGHAYVAREGQAGPRQLGIYDDSMVKGLTKMVARAHENQSAIAAQLAHAGQRAIGSGEYAPSGPSQVVEEGTVKAAAMTEDHIQSTVMAFGDAAQRAVESGCDAVQIHAAHGYLLSQFLSPHYNKREDSYGGNLENRARFLMEVYEEIRRCVGKNFPVLVKINSEDFLEDGLTVEESIAVIQELEKRGIDAVEMSGGTFESGKRIPSRGGTSRSEDREVYYRQAAQAYKAKIKIPLILVGGLLSLHVAQDVVDSGLGDYVALSRPLIREPLLVRRWAHQDKAKATCISCNQCFGTLFTEKALHCAVDAGNKK